MKLRHAALWVWERELGLPYKWGGDDPIAGFDCSGLVLEGLKSVGIVEKDADYTASSILNDLFKNKPRLVKYQLREGCLLFFATPENHIFHVEVVWDIVEGKVLTIGASGGGGKTTDIATAVAQNAYVKIRPRESWHYAIDPFSD